MNSMDLGLIGNGTISALVNSVGEIVWGCFPRFERTLTRSRRRDAEEDDDTAPKWHGRFLLFGGYAGGVVRWRLFQFQREGSE